MIPKTIHYCWFGRNPKPKLADKCIASWKKYCPDYEIIEWNEDNFDISAAPLYVQQAYEAKMWAFVADYVRLYVIYHCGGIYFDTDVELIKPIDDLLQYQAYFGFQGEKRVATGLGFGAEQYAPILKEMMEEYHLLKFLQENGEYDKTPCPQRNTEVLVKHDLKTDGTRQSLDGGIEVFPEDYFCPIDYDTERMHKTKNTYSIHWFSASWFDEQTKARRKKELRRNRIIRIIGESSYVKLWKLFHRRR